MERHYGLKLGDIVSYPGIPDAKFEVVALSPLDNNRAYLRPVEHPSAEPFPAVAEWCKKISTERGA